MKHPLLVLFLSSCLIFGIAGVFFLIRQAGITPPSEESLVGGLGLGDIQIVQQPEVTTLLSPAPFVSSVPVSPSPSALTPKPTSFAKPTLTPTPFSSPPLVTPLSGSLPNPTPVLTPTPVPLVSPSPVPLPSPSPLTPTPTPLAPTPSPIPSTPQPTPEPKSIPAAYSRIVISELQKQGITAKDEFVELFNPNSEPVDLTGWSLKKKTATGNESNLVSSGAFLGTILPFGYFLVTPQAEEDGTSTYQGSAAPDLFYSGKTYSFAKDNTLLLYNPAGELVDKVGFGEVQDFEGAPSQNHEPGQSLGRKVLGSTYQDTNNNAQDFEIQISTPKAKNQSYQDAILPPSSLPTSTPTPIPSGTGQGVVVINEIAWMGTKASANDEWIELFSPNAQPLNLTGWKLVAEDGAPSIELQGEILSYGYFLLERTADTTISDIAADLIYTGVLVDAGEVLHLYDASGLIVDSVQAGASWFAGHKEEKKTMERINAFGSGSDPNNWKTYSGSQGSAKDANGSLILGTPKSLNSTTSS